MTGAEEAVLIELGMTAVGKIWEVVKAARAGDVDVTATLEMLGKLHDELAAHNAKYQAALDAKFDTP